MQQIVSITDARNNLSRLVADVSQQDTSVVIVRDSVPEAVLLSYRRILETEQAKEKMWRLRFDRMMAAGKKVGRRWAKKRGINLDKLTEEKAYELVEKA
ncbi:type II toxin-antitoxin system Phd/YefM family antitoxin [Candidatus Collierbacteria bacterium]|nr:type II toxin-antitoxin system Phd/YefM family antitoxin [Candidatus Collierbacteria bacterium]